LTSTVPFVVAYSVRPTRSSTQRSQTPDLHRRSGHNLLPTVLPSVQYLLSLPQRKVQIRKRPSARPVATQATFDLAGNGARSVATPYAQTAAHHVASQPPMLPLQVYNVGPPVPSNTRNPVLRALTANTPGAMSHPRKTLFCGLRQRQDRRPCYTLSAMGGAAWAAA